MNRYILSLEQVRAGDAGTAGGKAANLGELAANGFPVPPGFVVNTSAYQEFFQALGTSDQVRDLDAVSGPDLTARCAALQQQIMDARMPDSLVDAIRDAHRELLAGKPDHLLCAVRSSATAEDLGGASFAGQHGTYYYVDAGRLLEMIQRCWASLWSVEAVRYRSTRGIAHGSVYMAVIVQEMVRSDVSGVAFTANPVNGARDEIVIESSWGLGAAIVDGRVTPDRYLVARDGLQVRERRIAEKRFMVQSHLASPQETRLETVAQARQRQETLAPDQIKAIAEWSLACERHFGVPQDVEWAIADGRVHLLQSRPITTLRRADEVGEVKGKWVLFKSLAENFTDPITPLTADMFSGLLPPGLRFIGGRLYLSLDVVRPLMPFDLSDEDLANVLYLTTTRVRPRLSLVKLPAALLASLVLYLVFAVIFSRTRRMPDDFMDGYRALCRNVEEDAALDAVAALQRLLIRPPLFEPIGHMVLFVNTASMRFAPWMAALKQMLFRWLPSLREDAVALLCSGSEGVLSAQMGRDIAALAAEARHVDAVKEMLARYPSEQVLSLMREEPAARGFMTRLDQFLAMHGHRALKEFELRSARWAENPAPVLGMIRNYLAFENGAAAHHHTSASARTRLEAEIREALTPLPLERALGIRWRLIRLAAGRARYYLKLRENSRFYHIMGFGSVRKKLIAMEADLLRQGKLKCKDDLFFMRWEEAVGLQAGRLRWVDVEDRIRGRRLEHVRLAKTAPPKTIGIGQSRPALASASDELEGQSASPGRYQGIARVILDPAADLVLQPGEVLVAPYTDPAWTPLFLTAGAAVVEVGSYLSHAGTVAREYAMPCVVDVLDCTSRIQTGYRVEVDGDRGVVRILERVTPA